MRTALCHLPGHPPRVSFLSNDINNSISSLARSALMRPPPRPYRRIQLYRTRPRLGHSRLTLFRQNFKEIGSGPGPIGRLAGSSPRLDLISLPLAPCRLHLLAHPAARPTLAIRPSSVPLTSLVSHLALPVTPRLCLCCRITPHPAVYIRPSRLHRRLLPPFQHRRLLCPGQNLSSYHRRTRITSSTDSLASRPRFPLPMLSEAQRVLL